MATAAPTIAVPLTSVVSATISTAPGPSDAEAAAKAHRGRPPGVKVPRWTPEEDEKLRQLVQQHGDRAWKQIATELEHGRSATAVEQHYNILIGKRKKPGVAGPRPNQDGSSLGLPGGRSMGPATDHASVRL